MCEMGFEAIGLWTPVYKPFYVFVWFGARRERGSCAGSYEPKGQDTPPLGLHVGQSRPPSRNVALSTVFTDAPRLLRMWHARKSSKSPK